MPLAATISTWLFASATFSQAAAADGTHTPFGLIILSSNGGSVWKGVPIFAATYSRLQSAYTAGDDNAVRTAFSNPFPGILFAVQSDGKGRNVFAVGSPGSTFSSSARCPTSALPPARCCSSPPHGMRRASSDKVITRRPVLSLRSAQANADVKITAASQTVAGLAVKAYPTILTSPNSGVSWRARESETER